MREIETDTGLPDGKRLIDYEAMPNIFKTKKNSKSFADIEDNQFKLFTTETDWAKFRVYHFMIHFEFKKWPVKNYPHASVYDGYAQVLIYKEPFVNNNPPTLGTEITCFE